MRRPPISLSNPDRPSTDKDDGWERVDSQNCAAATAVTAHFFMADLTGIATPIQSGAPGFIGRGLTSGGLPEFVVPNSEIQGFQFVLERVASLVGTAP